MNQAADTDNGPVDLRSIGAGGAGENGNGGFTSMPYDRERKRETMRGWIAMLLLLTLLAVIAAMMGIASYSTISCLENGTECSAQALEVTAIRSIGEVLLAPLVGLVGAVTGFYYGEKSATERQNAS